MVPQETLKVGMNIKTLIIAKLFQVGPFSMLVPRANMQALLMKPPMIIGYLRPMCLSMKIITTAGQNIRFAITPPINLYEAIAPRIVDVYIKITLIPVNYWPQAIINPYNVAFL